MYEAQTQSAILARLLDEAATTLKKSQGSFYYDAVSPLAVELALAYIALDRVLALGFAQTTEGTYLDYRAAEHGVTRTAAAKAAGTVTFTGDAGSTIAAGSIVSTSGGVQFETDALATVEAGGTVDAAVTAVTAGASGNVAIGAIDSIPVSIEGISSVTNAAATTGGADEETDTDLLDRLLEAVREPATSGNQYHYKAWAKEVTGVGDAKVYPEWDGNGTVKVVIIDDDMTPADASLVTDVDDYIDEVRPIGAAVTVESATSLSINVSATLTMATGYTVVGVQDAVEAAITAYLKEIAFEQTFVSYAQIGNRILEVEGVLDYASLLVNSGTSNVSVSATSASTQVSVLGTVTLS